LGAHCGRERRQGDQLPGEGPPAPALRRAEPVRRADGGRWARLLTEQRNPRSRDLDRLATARVVSLLLDEDRRGLVAAARERASRARGARLLAETLERGRDVVFTGAGTSGRLGVLEAAECPPTFGSDPRRIRAVMAGGRESVFRSREGAEDRLDHGRREGGRHRRGGPPAGGAPRAVPPLPPPRPPPPPPPRGPTLPPAPRPAR